MKLADYLNQRGRGSSYRLAKSLKVQATNVYLWSKEKSPVPPLRCFQIELLTNGEVTCEELNKTFDWNLAWSVFNKRNCNSTFSNEKLIASA